MDARDESRADRRGDEGPTRESAVDFRTPTRRVGDPVVTRERLRGAVGWLMRSASTTSGLARESWRFGRGWGPTGTIATADFVATACRVASARVVPIDEARILASGRALLERQRRDGAFEPSSSDEDEEPATSAAVTAFAHLYAWNGDPQARAAAQRGAARILAARARPSAAVALSTAWVATGDARFYEAACDGRSAALARLEARSSVPLGVVQEAVTDLEVAWTIAEHLAQEFELEPVARDLSRTLVARIETAGGALARGYAVDGAVVRPGVDVDSACRVASVLCGMHARRRDPRARFAAALALESVCDRLGSSRSPFGDRGAPAVAPGPFARRDAATTSAFAIALASLASGRSPAMWILTVPDAARPDGPRGANSREVKP